MNNSKDHRNKFNYNHIEGGNKMIVQQQSQCGWKLTSKLK